MIFLKFDSYIVHFIQNIIVFKTIGMNEFNYKSNSKNLKNKSDINRL